MTLDARERRIEALETALQDEESVSCGLTVEEIHDLVKVKTLLGRLVEAYPLGGLDGLLQEFVDTLRGHGAECQNPESCGPLGCLLAKIYHVRKVLTDARRALEK